MDSSLTSSTSPFSSRGVRLDARPLAPAPNLRQLRVQLPTLKHHHHSANALLTSILNLHLLPGCLMISVSMRILAPFAKYAGRLGHLSRSQPA
jgi:hypothetical protein